MNLRLMMVLMAACLPLSGVTAQNVREKICMDQGWRFHLGHAADPAKDFGCGTEYFNYLTKANSIHNEGPYAAKFDDSGWQQISLPHDWATTLPYDAKASHSHGYKTVGWQFPETSVGWYRKTFALPKEDEGKRITLQFDGVFRNARVWFNGFYMGCEPSGYATQVYDVTEYANYGGDNLICVRADASLEEGWYYEGAGIYRDVWLLKAAAVSVAPFGTFVYADLQPPYDEAVINVKTVVENTSIKTQTFTVEQRLIDAEGNEVTHQSDTQQERLRAKDRKQVHHVMKIKQPRLWSVDHPYLYKVETIVKQGGRVVDIYETTTGLRQVEFDAERGFLLNGQPLKLKGVNMHQDHAGVGAALPEALMAWRIRKLKEMGCNGYRSSHNPVSPALLDICDREGMLVIDENRLSGINQEHRRLLENMIKRDRNHPSVILWSDGNEEWGMENTVQGRRVAEAMRQFTSLLDPTRPSCMANAGGGEMIKGLDVVGFNYIVQNSVDERKRNNPSWKIVGTEETTGCGTRGVYYNDQTGRMVSMNRDTTHHHVWNVIERGWKFYAERPWAAGVFFWTGFDYRGEPNPLKYPAHDSEFGILDYCGFPKDEAWYLKAWWTDEPVLHIFPHWNLKGHEGEEVELWVYSNCEEVELTVNGKRLARKAMPLNGHLSWKAVYRPGRVVATGYKHGRRILTQTIETTKPASRIVAEADRNTLAADGRDVAVVTVKLVDSKGRLVPDASQMLTLHVEGDGRILGVGNGDPAWLGEDHPAAPACHDFCVPAFNGLAQVLVQSGPSASSLTLSVSAPTLQATSLTLAAQ